MRKKVFDVRDFGVISNSDQLQTEKIQAAIDACFMQGGGEVEITKGDYIIAGIRLRSNVVLRLQRDAHLIGSRNPRDYDIKDDEIEPYKEEDKTEKVWIHPRGYENVSNGNENTVKIENTEIMDDFEFMKKCLSTWNNGLIRAVDAHNISIICEEGAYIDGKDCFDEKGEEHYRGPHAISIHRCENVRLKNVHIKNSANWAFALFDSQNITVEKALVEAGHDGVHMTSCDNIVIENCEFYCGDDCVAGIDNLNLKVHNCIMNTACSAMRFGGTNALIENCKAYGPAKYLFRGSLAPDEKKKGTVANGNHRFNMLGFFTFYSDYTRDIRYLPGNIIIKDCIVENADRFLHYNFSGNETWQKNKPLSSIEFENVKAIGVKNPLTAYGDVEIPISLYMKNCEIQFVDDREDLPFMYISNAEKVLLKDTVVRNLKSDVLIKKWNDSGDFTFDNFMCENFTGEISMIAKEKFVCQPI